MAGVILQNKLITSIIFTIILMIQTSICISQETSAKAGKVVIVTMAQCCEKTAWTEAEIDVLEELETFSLNIQSVSGTESLRDHLPASLVEIAQHNNASVVLHLYRENSGLFRADILSVHPQKEPKLQQLNFKADIDFDILPTAVLRIVETVRAGLLYGKKPTPRTNKKLLPPPVPVPKYRKTGLNISISRLMSPGRVRPSLGMGAAMNVKPTPHSMVDLDINWTAQAPDIEYQGEAATFEALILRSTLFWDIIPKGIVHPALGLYGGILIAWTEGKSTTEESNYKQREVVAYLGGTGRIGMDITTHLTVVLGVRSGFLIPKIKIYLLDTLTSSYGRPLVELFSAFELRF
jgi:hypothetical protein